MIALLLSIVMTVGSISSTSVLAAETTAEKAVTIEEETVEEATESSEEANTADYVEVIGDNPSQGKTEAAEKPEIMEPPFDDKNEIVSENGSEGLSVEEIENEDSQKPSMASEDNVIASGDCSATENDHVIWVLSETNGINTLTISGQGKVADYCNGKWGTSFDKVIIESGVISIGSNAFDDSNIESIEIADSVSFIGEYAFRDCKNLTSVQIPYGVRTLSWGLFDGCTSLSSVILPDTIERTDYEVFMGCTSLRSIILPESICIIEHGVFAESGLESISIPGNCESIQVAAFSDCENLTSVNLSEGVKRLYNGCFSGCIKLSIVKIPSSVTLLGEGVFYGDSSLKSIQFNGNAPQINPSAFSGVTATVYYPMGDDTWTDIIGQNYGGTITWVPWDPNSGEEEKKESLGWCINNNKVSFGYGWNYKVSPDVFGSLYGVNPSSVLYTTLVEIFSSWGGSCFGMSLLAGSDYMGTIDLKSYFNQEGSCLSEYGYSEVQNHEGKEVFTVVGNSDIIKTIEKAHFSQMSKEFKNAEIFHNDDKYTELINYLKNTHNVTMICFEVSAGRHAVLVNPDEEIVEISEPGWYRIPIYDPNNPLGKERLNNPHPWYTEDKTYILLDTNKGMFNYVTKDKTYASDHRFLNQRYIKFYDLSRISASFFNSRLTLQWNNPLELFFGFTSDNITINSDDQTILDISDGCLINQADGYEYDVMYNGFDEPALRYLGIKNDGKISYKCDAGNSFVTNPADNEIYLVTNSDNASVSVLDDRIVVQADEDTDVTVIHRTENEQEYIEYNCTVFLNEGERIEGLTENGSDIFVTDSQNDADVKKDVNGTITEETIIQCQAIDSSETVKISIPEDTFVYTGKAITPVISIKDGDKVLTEGIDYTIAYDNNINAGTAQIIITGIRKYIGTITKSFTINKAVNKVTAKNYIKTYSTKAQSFWTGAKVADGTRSFKSSNKAVVVSKSGKVTIKPKFIGKATIKITAPETQNYQKSTKKITITVNPTKTALSSVTSPSAGKMTVKWKKNAVGTGYQIQYSTSSKFTSPKAVSVTKNTTLTKTIGSLAKGKKYYVRIRTYKTVGKTKFYSAWSAAKTVTVKR